MHLPVPEFPKRVAYQETAPLPDGQPRDATSQPSFAVGREQWGLCATDQRSGLSHSAEQSGVPSQLGQKSRDGRATEDRTEQYEHRELPAPKPPVAVRSHRVNPARLPDL